MRLRVTKEFDEDLLDVYVVFYFLHVGSPGLILFIREEIIHLVLHFINLLTYSLVIRKTLIRGHNSTVLRVFKSNLISSIKMVYFHSKFKWNRCWKNQWQGCCSAVDARVRSWLSHNKDVSSFWAGNFAFRCIFIQDSAGSDVSIAKIWVQLGRIWVLGCKQSLSLLTVLFPWNYTNFDFSGALH